MKYKVLVIIIAAILAAGIIGSIAVINSTDKSTVRVLSDGKEIYRADLRTAQDTVFDVEYQGHVNTVEVRDHQIRVQSADCPDHSGKRGLQGLQRHEAEGQDRIHCDPLHGHGRSDRSQ